MGYALHVFVSSTCYELRDLRASVKAWLEGLGLVPLLSDEAGFPHVDTKMPPYATCLRVLEECPLVVGIVDRKYGRSFDDWGPYPEYAGLAPTHAELRHALATKKSLVLYVHRDVWAFYEAWRKNRSLFIQGTPPQGLDERTLLMFEELKTLPVPPWVGQFSDVRDVIADLQATFVNHVYAHLREQERQSRDLAGYLLERIFEAAPEVRAQIEAKLSPSLVARLESLRSEHAALEATAQQERERSADAVQQARVEKDAVAKEIGEVSGELAQARLWLAMAAVKDANWLHFIRSTLMPKQPGRAPFHNAAEIAIRGYNTAPHRQSSPS